MGNAILWVQTTLCTTLFTVVNKNYFYTIDSQEMCVFSLSQLLLLYKVLRLMHSPQEAKKKNLKNWITSDKPCTRADGEMAGSCSPGIRVQDLTL